MTETDAPAEPVLTEEGHQVSLGVNGVNSQSNLLSCVAGQCS